MSENIFARRLRTDALPDVLVDALTVDEMEINGDDTAKWW